ncbi:DUF5602 domain-containing protein [Priestia koreensis]|uniref:DUF5602 domain-containing protein n=1 Tax=Priestia koreensis TaxID=284581 RepID=UPI0006A998F3|nr:DUF5602 domain-containing protein [Priestia koreensis]
MNALASILKKDYETVLTTNKDQSVYLLVLPKGTMQMTPSVPKMGAHWFNPKADLYQAEDGVTVFKTIYGVEKGKLVFIEQMIAQKHLAEGKSFTDFDGMQGLPSPAIDHSNIEFIAHGHEGFEVPHYDIHHYFISKAEQDQIKGDGAPPAHTH